MNEFYTADADHCARCGHRIHNDQGCLFVPDVGFVCNDCAPAEEPDKREADKTQRKGD